MAPLAFGPHIGSAKSLGTVSVLASGTSGYEIAGTIGGLVASATAIVALVMSVAKSNRSREREYQNEIRDAEHRGFERGTEQLSAVETDRDYWRSLVMQGLVDGRDAAARVEPPPRRRPEARRQPRREEENEV